MQIVKASELPGSNSSRLFEGAEHTGAGVSFFVVDGQQPGTGPDLHRHPYDETWLVQHGCVAVEISGERAEAGPGDIFTAPAGASHKFKCVGPDPARLICIHASPRLVQEDLE